MQSNEKLPPFVPVRTIVDTGHGSTPERLTTVAVSLYNYESHIGECLDSVASQTRHGLDLIVVDDCSKDGSLSVAERWFASHGGRFHRARLVQTVQNSGLAAARNTAFAAVATPYVFVLDADNAIFPPCIERLEAALEDSEATFAYSYIQKFGTVSAVLNIGSWNADRLRLSNYIDAMVLMRREAWRVAGGYRKMRVTGWEDYQHWLDLSIRGGRGIQVHEFLCRYRVHGESMLHQITMKPENYEVVLDEIRGSNAEFFA